MRSPVRTGLPDLRAPIAIAVRRCPGTDENRVDARVGAELRPGRDHLRDGHELVPGQYTPIARARPRTSTGVMTGWRAERVGRILSIRGPRSTLTGVPIRTPFPVVALGGGG